MNATCIIYLQYWLIQPNVATTFLGHLAILKKQYCQNKTMLPIGVSHDLLLDVDLFDEQVSIFFVIMQSNYIATMQSH
jgi:hypothetical protein